MSGLEGLLEGKVLVKRYRIEQVIGRGGFAAVYSAADERLGRTVAVKVITLAAPDTAMHEQLRERFQREARAAAGLPQHPNVVTVYDFGTDPPTGIDFLVMELLRGEDLASRLAREPRLPLEVALGILRETVEGIAVGHRAGLVHRDVKPGNVFLAEPLTDEPFRVCVLDFGIARVLADEGTAARLTQQGSTPLSPAYASPEQLAGDADLTCASDVFSLGVLAYQLLTGERPFGTERRRGAGGWEAKPLRELNPDVPQAVADVVHRALSYDPAARYPDAGELGDALDAAAGTSPSAPADEDDDRTRTRVVPLAAAGAAGLAAGAAGAAAAHSISSPTPADDEDDRTLLARPTSAPSAGTGAAVGAGAAGVAAGAAAADRTSVAPDRASVAPPTSAPRREPVAAGPPPKKRGMSGVMLFVALLLVGAAGAAVMLDRGGGSKGDGDRKAPADTAASAPTAAPTTGHPASGGTADVPVSASPPTTTTTVTTGGTTPPTTDGGTAPTDAGAATQPSAPSTSPEPGSTVSPTPAAPAPTNPGTRPPPAAPAPAPAAPRPAAPQPAAPRPAPTQPTTPAPAPTQPAPTQPAPPPVLPSPPPDTAHMNPVPTTGPRDTLRIPPTMPPPPQPQSPPPPGGAPPAR
jgi:serine/threonine protein kinase